MSNIRPIGPPLRHGFVLAGDGLSRRRFLTRAALWSGSLAVRWPVVAGPFSPEDLGKLVPPDKKLRPDWVESLFARGTPTVYRGADLEKIGMPIGGICAGQLYLGGDGRLWHWDIFNQVLNTNEAHYAKPLRPESPLAQGFAIRTRAGTQSQTRPLDRTGFAEVSFRGEYPLGRVEYRDPGAPVSVTLEGFSPFIPLNVEDSSLPATVMHFTVRNTSQTPVRVDLLGWLENAVCLHTGEPGEGTRRNRIVRRPGMTLLDCTANPTPEPMGTTLRPDIPFDDFETVTYQGWIATGTAFGRGPIEAARMPAYQGDVGAHGQRLVNSHNARQGETVTQADAHVGTLTSQPFGIARNYITFLIGGGAHPGSTCLNLLVNGQVVCSATGKNENRMRPHSFDVRPWLGQTARLQIVDNESGPWGNIGIDDIVFSDRRREGTSKLEARSDYGTMSLALVGREGRDRAGAAAPAASLPATLLDGPAWPRNTVATKPFGEPLVGALARGFKLSPGQEKTVTFVVAWHFPNLQLSRLPGGRHYAQRFTSATGVADYVGRRLETLAQQTRLWHDTWYDSSLPYWFLDRTFANTSILATSTCHWFADGRFYGWEGVGCCEGTCTHVWHYAHAVARLFPALERSLRERVDFGVAFDRVTGRIRFRAEHNDHWAVDGQAGVILRTYREHQMSRDGAFLSRLWPSVKQALEFLRSKDLGLDGIIDGPQHNTLDADWYGQVAWLSGLYLAALRAGEEMARDMDDDGYAFRCREILVRGQQAMDERLFNGEYYVQLPDAAHGRTVGSYDGCEIDQVFGQSWCWQVGLGRILDPAKVNSALRSLWRYNFTPDVGPYRAAHRPGRWYAMAGEGGLLMCSWPRGEEKRIQESFDFYFNECMTGFEYQVASHMLWEGLLEEGLAITRTIHDRYHPSGRNPWNEVECGDHYARAMASYGVFLAACGFEYHGPRGRLGFAPRLGPQQFKAAFTTAEGWGTYAQTTKSDRMTAEVSVKWGRLRLRTIALAPPKGSRPTSATVMVDGKPISATLASSADRAEIRFNAWLALDQGQRLEVVLQAGPGTTP